MNLSGGPPALPAADLRDPRIRYTFVDVAMKVVNDGPWYFVLAVILVLTLRGTTSVAETLNGVALALLARSKPPEQPDKAHLVRGITAALGVVLLCAAIHVVM